MRKKVLSKDKIIEIAENIIKTESLSACTARNISKHAHTALGTIYNYFSSREELLLAVFLDSWDKTKDQLLLILKEETDLKTKVLRMFKKVDEDIKNRGGIGDYLISSIKSDHANIVLDKIIPILVSLLKQSDKTKQMDEKTLKMNAEWIYFGSIYMRKKEEDLDLFYQQVIELFF